MARIAKSTKTTKPVARKRSAGRPTPTAVKVGAKARLPKVTKVAAAKRASPAPAAQKVSKDDLRAQVEKLERGNATLRAKSREATRAAKTAAVRIAELEGQVARLEKRLAVQTTTTVGNSGGGGGGGRSASASKLAPTSTRGRRPKRHEIDPEDAVPPGVTIEEPAHPDQEAKEARENLAAHLGEQASENETL